MEVNPPTLQQLNDSLPLVSGIAFFQHDQSFLVAGQDEDFSNEISYLVFRHNSQTIRTIGHAGNCMCPIWALSAGSKLASAHFASFRIWDLSCGQAVATAGPGLSAVQSRHLIGGQITAYLAGFKLAFCPAAVPWNTSTVHMMLQPCSFWRACSLRQALSMVLLLSAATLNALASSGLACDGPASDDTSGRL